MLQGCRRNDGAEDALHGAHETVFPIRQGDEEIDACGSLKMGRVRGGEVGQGREFCNH